MGLLVQYGVKQLLNLNLSPEQVEKAVSNLYGLSSQRLHQKYSQFQVTSTDRVTIQHVGSLAVILGLVAQKLDETSPSTRKQVYEKAQKTEQATRWLDYWNKNKAEALLFLLETPLLAEILENNK